MTLRRRSPEEADDGQAKRDDVEAAAIAARTDQAAHGRDGFGLPSRNSRARRRVESGSISAHVAWPGSPASRADATQGMSRGDVESTPVSVAPVQVGDTFRDLDRAEVLGLRADDPDAVRHPRVEVPALIDLDPVRSIVH